MPISTCLKAALYICIPVILIANGVAWLIEKFIPTSFQLFTAIAISVVIACLVVKCVEVLVKNGAL